jgi:MoaA/NifB/PqqE/SkfB family radical SAM enzyme
MLQSLKKRFKYYKRLKGVPRYANMLINPRPVLVNLEVIKNCNASCHFCSCWRTKGGPKLNDYGPVIRKIKPIAVSINGGEPLLRKDIYDIVRQIRPYTIYETMITNAALLTVEKAFKLKEAGLDQITISMDYMDDQHDKVRGIPNLSSHIKTLVPELVSRGFDNVVINTIIMDSNLDQVVDIAKQTHKWGVKSSFSAYSSYKADNNREVIESEKQKSKLKNVIDELKFLRRKNKNISSSEYFFNHVPPFFEHKAIGGCKAGQRWVTITPDGYVQPCSELERVCHYTEYSPDLFGDVSCDVCWYACRAEAQAPVTLKRIGEWISG